MSAARRLRGVLAHRRLPVGVAIVAFLLAVPALRGGFQLDEGLFNVPMTRYHRAPEVRFASGDRVVLAGFSAEILGLNAAGDPEDLLFRFAVPLEDPSLRWLAWSDGLYAPWQPPAVGESTRLAMPRGLFE